MVSTYFSGLRIMNHRPTEVIERKRGAIEVSCGSMFSGKTEELIRRLKRARLATPKVEIFRPSVDQRDHEINVVSHDSNYMPSSPVQSSSQILLLTNDVDVVGIDEAQFFDNELPNVCLNLANQGMRVIIAGLDMDFKGVPFGPIPHLMAIADFVTKVHAICMDCGDLALFSYRTISDDSLIVLGEKESYIPLCRTCYNKRK